MCLPYSSPALKKKGGRKNFPELICTKQTYRAVGNARVSVQKGPEHAKSQRKRMAEIITSPKTLDQKVVLKGTLMFVLRPPSVAKCYKLRSCHRNSHGLISSPLSCLMWNE